MFGKSTEYHSKSSQELTQQTELDKLNAKLNEHSTKIASHWNKTERFSRTASEKISELNQSINSQFVNSNKQSQQLESLNVKYADTEQQIHELKNQLQSVMIKAQELALSNKALVEKLSKQEDLKRRQKIAEINEKDTGLKIVNIVMAVLALLAVVAAIYLGWRQE